MPKYFSAIFLLSCIFLAACSTFAPQPTATPVPTQQIHPTPYGDTAGTMTSPQGIPAPTETQTSSPPTGEVPTPVPTMPDIFTQLNPSDAPLAKWNGIRIMPGALAGGGGETTYYFTTKSSVDAIHAFYDKDLVNIGYSPLAVGKGENNTLVLFYENTNGTLSISLFTQGDVVLVMLVK
jgi:hypothetical protein